MTPPARCCASSARGKPPGRRPICCVPGSNATACREPYTPTGRTCMCACPTCRSGCGEKPRSPVRTDVRQAGIRIIAASSRQAKGRGDRVHCTHQDRLVKKLRLAAVSNYDDANAYLQEHYIAQHNRHYARPATAEADYHRQRPTARQLDEVFWLEQERVLSADWVVRYKNRLLQLARQNRHWAPAQSRVLVRENEPGHIVIHYRGQSLPFREIPLASSTARSRGRGAAPSPATPSPKPTAAAGRPHRSPAGNHPWRQGWQNMKTPAFSPAW